MSKRILMMVLMCGASTAAIAETWVVDCPLFFYRDPLAPVQIAKDEGWKMETDQTNLRLSCGNARIYPALNTMNCFYGSVYRGGYPYKFSKPIPDGATCERTPTEDSCSFTCTRTSPPQKIDPRIKFPNELLKIRPQ